MSRIAVPRGNAGHSFPIFDLTPASPRWSLLTPGEQHAATRTQANRPVAFLCLARQIIRECLIDLRLARTVGQWRELSDRLDRVKAVLFDGQDDDAIRQHFLAPLRARFILLGVDRDEVERIAPELVESVVRLRTVGTWRPAGADSAWPGSAEWDIRRPPSDESARAAGERRWVEDGRVLYEDETSWKGRYLDDELRAFPADPPPDPFAVAYGPIVDRRALALVPALQQEVPAGSARAAIAFATRYVKELLWTAGPMVGRAAHFERQDADHAYAAAQQLESLSAALRSAWASAELRERLHLVRRDRGHYRVAGIVRPSAHEAIEELARAVMAAYRGAVGRVVFADSSETDRMWHGPWHGHEVARAFPAVKEGHPELLSVFESVSVQTLEADLDRESAELMAAVVVPPGEPDRPPRGDGNTSTVGSEPDVEGGAPANLDRTDEETTQPPPTWGVLDQTKRLILAALGRATDRLEGKKLAKNAPCSYSTLRKHIPRLVDWGYADGLSAGYAITDLGRSILPTRK